MVRKCAQEMLSMRSLLRTGSVPIGKVSQSVHIMDVQTLLGVREGLQLLLVRTSWRHHEGAVVPGVDPHGLSK